MWTDTTRAHHARVGLALPTDLTDEEWAVLEPLLPPPSSVGRPRKWPLRRIIEAILYLLRGGLPWRMLPPSFPPVSTVRRWFYLWRDNGLWLSLNHILLMAVREVSVMFLGDRSVQARRAPIGRNGKRIVQIEAPDRDETVEVSIGFSTLPPADLPFTLPGYGKVLSIRTLAGNRFLYVCEAKRPFPYCKLDGTVDTDRFPLPDTPLQGLYRADPDIPVVLRVLQMATGQIYGI